jgi:hypothetical protein
VLQQVVLALQMKIAPGSTGACKSNVMLFLHQQHRKRTPAKCSLTRHEQQQQQRRARQQTQTS